MEGGGTPPPVLQWDKKPSAYRVKILSKGVEHPPPPPSATTR